MVIDGRVFMVKYQGDKPYCLVERKKDDTGQFKDSNMWHDSQYLPKASWSIIRRALAASEMKNDLVS